MWLPWTVKPPPLAAVTVPAELVVSPQSIVAVKSAAAAAGSASVKPNVSCAGVTPSTPFVIVSVPAVSGALVTVAWPVAEAVLPPMSVTVTTTG